MPLMAEVRIKNYTKTGFSSSRLVQLPPPLNVQTSSLRENVKTLIGHHHFRSFNDLFCIELKHILHMFVASGHKEGPSITTYVVQDSPVSTNVGFCIKSHWIKEPILQGKKEIKQKKKSMAVGLWNPLVLYLVLPIFKSGWKIF